MTTRVVSFGSYEFSDSVVAFQDDFQQLALRTVQLPGAPGGYSEYGTSAPPAQIGHVAYRHMLTASSPQSMRAKIDALRALAGDGMQRLTVLPYPGATPRFCMATIENVQIAERVTDRPHAQIPVTISWEVPDPRWYSDPYNVPLWGQFDWGDGSKWGGTCAPTLVSGLSNDLTITPGGNAPTRPVISVMALSTQVVTSVTIQRIVRDQVVDSVARSGSFGPNGTLVIDCRALSVRLNSLSAYNSAFSVLRPDRWFELQPGANTVRVLLGSGGDAAYVRVFSYDAFY